VKVLNARPAATPTYTRGQKQQRRLLANNHKDAITTPSLPRSFPVWTNVILIRLIRQYGHKLSSMYMCMWIRIRDIWEYQTVKSSSPNIEVQTQPSHVIPPTGSPIGMGIVLMAHVTWPRR